MAQFPGNPKRLDPYKNFKFRVYFVGRNDPVLGVSKLSGPSRKTEVVSHRDGANHNHSVKAPGRTDFEALTLERGVTHDPDFEAWASLVWANPDAQLGAQLSLANFRRDLYIEVLNEAGQKVMGYTVFRCWVSEYKPVGDFDANANAVLIEHIKVENEGFVRDTAVPIPQEFAIA
jgi:phage tail-like protein